jgi:hypothetical protein
LFEKTSVTLTVDDLALLINNHVRVPLRVGKHQLAYVFVAYVLVPRVTANSHIPAFRTVQTRSVWTVTNVHVVAITVKQIGQSQRQPTRGVVSGQRK